MKFDIKKTQKFIKDNSPAILTGLTIVGTIATTYFGIKSGMKIAEVTNKEEIDKKEVIKAALPAVITCAATIGCSIGSDMAHRKNKSDLLALTAMIGSSYSGYRREIIKRYGEEVDKEIVDTVASHSEHMYMASDVPDKVCHWLIDMCQEDIPIYEVDALERDIIHAEYHLNRNYILCGQQSVYNLLVLLGLENPKNKKWTVNDDYGWQIDDCEIYFLDFEHEKIDDNTFRLHPIWAPWYDYQNLNMFGEINNDHEIAPFGDAV